MNIVERIFSSTGFKRRVSSAISAATGILVGTSEIVTGVPLSGITPIFDAATASAAAIGTVGVVHAAKEKTIKPYKSGTISSIFATLAFIAYYVPPLSPYTFLLQSIAAGFGAVGVVVPGPSEDE